MKRAFVFKTELWVPIYTGLSASSLEEFINCLELIDEGSLLYHLYIHLFHPNVYYFNSFSHWLYINGYKSLAEKLTFIDPTNYCSLEDVRRKMLSVLKERKEDLKKEVEPFYFMSIHREVFETGYVASSLEELIEGIENSSINSVFYHMISSRLEKESSGNDYSQWLIHMGYVEKAYQIGRLDVYTIDLFKLKERILEILERR